MRERRECTWLLGRLAKLTRSGRRVGRQAQMRAMQVSGTVQ
jgi:hypothetical protein